jgi:cathepsin F
MATAIASGHLSICVDATAFQTYSSGILGASCGDSINHCVQIVGAGVDNGTPYWTVRNSWSTSWGEDGYCRVQYGINACGIASDATTATIA